MVAVQVLKNKNRSLSDESGFTMTALLFLMLISVILATGVIVSYKTDSKLEAVKKSGLSMKNIKDALIVYQASHSFLMPCPAAPSTGNGLSRTDCITVAGDEFGVVPWRTIGLKKNDVIDGFGRYITYAVTPELTDGSSTEGKLQVLDGVLGTADLCNTGNNEKCAFVLVSHGRNGLGAFIPFGIGVPTKHLEIENTDSDYIFRRAPLNENESSNDYFDDKLVWDRLKSP